MQPVFPTEHVKTEEFELWIQYPARGVVQTRALGKLTVDSARHMMRAFDRVAADAKTVEAYHDWEGIEHYASDAREEYVRWASAHREQVGAVNILVRSKMMAMALAVANLKLGYLVPFSDRDAFERARSSALLKRRVEQRG